MRRVACVALLVFLAGCSDGSPPTDDTPDDSAGFEDDYEDVKPTATTGVLLGVVVDEAIRPLAAVKVAVNLPDGTLQEKTTDSEGRFAFGDLDPGLYLLQFTHAQYSTLSSSVEVKAGEEDPPVHRFQVTRLFAQEPFTEMITYDGYIQCAYAFALSSTCANDYTRVVGRTCAPDPASDTCTDQCAGGCLRDQQVANQAGNRREYVSTVGPGWQSVIIEATWDATSEAGKELGFTVSYFSRPDTGHWFGGTGGADPLRIQFDTGVEHEGASYASDQPGQIPVNGTDELFTLFSANSFNVAANQAFQSYQTIYYYAIPEEGWSFIVNGPPPY